MLEEQLCTHDLLRFDRCAGGWGREEVVGVSLKMRVMK
jgi:hypothetical protein